MTKRFLLEDGWQYHHITSWTIGRQKLFGDEEKAHFGELVHAYADFLGIRALTYAVLDDRFHLLIGTNPHETQECAAKMSDADIVERTKAIAPYVITTMTSRMAEELAQGDKKAAAKTRADVLSRFGDLSTFVCELKVHFSRWFNRRHGRRGTLWEGRFEDVLVEGDRLALETVGAFIDLAPVRDGVVNDPADYPYCGFGEAQESTAGAARRGIAIAVGMEDEIGGPPSKYWKVAARRYRDVLFGNGKNALKVDPAKLRAALEDNAQLSREEALRCDVRHFINGGVLGSHEFVAGIVESEQEKGWFNPKRISRSNALPAADWQGLRSLRNLTVRSIAVPETLGGG